MSQEEHDGHTVSAVAEHAAEKYEPDGHDARQWVHGAVENAIGAKYEAAHVVQVVEAPPVAVLQPWPAGQPVTLHVAALARMHAHTSRAHRRERSSIARAFPRQKKGPMSKSVKNGGQGRENCLIIILTSVATPENGEKLSRTGMLAAWHNLRVRWKGLNGETADLFFCCWKNRSSTTDCISTVMQDSPLALRNAPQHSRPDTVLQFE